MIFFFKFCLNFPRALNFLFFLWILHLLLSFLIYLFSYFFLFSSFILFNCYSFYRRHLMFSTLHFPHFLLLLLFSLYFPRSSSSKCPFSLDHKCAQSLPGQHGLFDCYAGANSYVPSLSFSSYSTIKFSSIHHLSRSFECTQLF